MVVHRHLEFLKHKNSSICLCAIAKAFNLHYMTFMTPGKAANMYLGEKSAL